MQADTISVTASTTGGITVYSSPFAGELVDFTITSTSATTTADWTITHAESTAAIITESNVTLPITRDPVRAVYTSTALALGLSTTGGPLAPARWAFGNERVKFVGAQVGASSTHKITVRIRGSFLNTGGSTA